MTKPNLPTSVLTLMALGVVYGDIGTSPLYALRECFHGAHAIAPTPENILGIFSLIIWSLIILISLKYVLYVMRADNHGEGGAMAQISLINHARKGKNNLVFVFLGILGASLMYSDGVITPAISVLSAVEGLTVAIPGLSSAVIQMITIVVLIGLFYIQSHGTSILGKFFGPVILLWFSTIGLIGIPQILEHPQILSAINPLLAINFVANFSMESFLVLGSVFLVVTGGEALYTDIGHFGRTPIKYGWFGVVLPGLFLNYAGQSALLLEHPELATNPFYHLVPDWATYPMIILATLTTVIASQAVITGAFSLTKQAIQLGYLPRLEIEHTSASAIGQIFIPRVNIILAIVTILLVLTFHNSSNLASAYGIAVSGTMIITTILMFIISRDCWGWSLPKSIALTSIFLIFDGVFFAANAIKIPQGGWAPIVMAVLIVFIMTTWRKGRQLLGKRVREMTISEADLVEILVRRPPERVPGCAIFMSSDPHGIPLALLHNMRHNKIIHDSVFILTIITETKPVIPEQERLTVEEIGYNIYRVIAHYGFTEEPSIADIVINLKEKDFEIYLSELTFFLGKETVLARKHIPGMNYWREKFFIFLQRNAQNATDFYKVPTKQAFEIGLRVEI